MKKLGVFVISVFLLGCIPSLQTNNETGKGETQAVLVANEKMDSEKETAVIWQIGSTIDRRPLYETEIGLRVIGRILEIEGCDNYWGILGVYGGVYTYGTFEVLKVFKGDAREGDVRRFAIAGGTIPYDDYAKAIDPETLEKQVRVASENGMGIPDEVNVVMCETQLVEGKVYYMVASDIQEIHGEVNLVYPYHETFMAVDEATLGEEDIMGYDTEYNGWFPVSLIWFPDGPDDKRLSNE